MESLTVDRSGFARFRLAAVLIAFLVQAWPASASDYCTTVDLSNDAAPVSDQGATPSCYAYTAATLIQAYADTKLNRASSITGAGLFDQVKNGNKWVEDANTGRVCNALTLGARSEPGIPACVNFDFVPGVQDTDRGSRQGPKVLRPPTEMILRMHSLLDRATQDARSRVPFGIEYCSRVLQADGEFIHRRDFLEDLNYLNQSGATRNFTQDCGFHASVVVGRERRTDGRCYFLVQNSWGEACWRYPSDKRPCEKGRIWVPESELGRNTLRVVNFVQ